MGGDSEDVITLGVGGIKQEEDETTVAVKDEEGAAGPLVVKEEVGDAATVGVKRRRRKEETRSRTGRRDFVKRKKRANQPTQSVLLTASRASFLCMSLTFTVRRVDSLGFIWTLSLPCDRSAMLVLCLPYVVQSRLCRTLGLLLCTRSPSFSV